MNNIITIRGSNNGISGINKRNNSNSNSNSNSDNKGNSRNSDSTRCRSNKNDGSTETRKFWDRRRLLLLLPLLLQLGISYDLGSVVGVNVVAAVSAYQYQRRQHRHHHRHKPQPPYHPSFVVRRRRHPPSRRDVRRTCFLTPTATTTRTGMATMAMIPIPSGPTPSSVFVDQKNNEKQSANNVYDHLPSLSYLPFPPKRKSVTATCCSLRAGDSSSNRNDTDGGSTTTSSTTTSSSGRNDDQEVEDKDSANDDQEQEGDDDEEEDDDDEEVPTGPIVEYSWERNGGEPPTKVLVLMDCFCPYHGQYLLSRIKANYPRVAAVMVLSDYVREYLLSTEPENRRQWQAAKFPRTPRRIRQWKSKLGGGGHGGSDRAEWVGVYCESDSGLEDAERMRELLRVTCRDEPAVSEARRNKYLMNERVRDYFVQEQQRQQRQGQQQLLEEEGTKNNDYGTASDGTRPIRSIPVVQQRLCQNVEEAYEFAQSYFSESRRVVMKPYRGVATESVYLCESMDAISNAWNRITSTGIFGSLQHDKHHDTVLIQECLVGTEYAVDVVSRYSRGAEGEEGEEADGSDEGRQEHKVAAVWRYDKRPANGASFCYYRTQLVDSGTDPNVDRVVAYVRQTLRALGIRYGISHNEVIVTQDELEDETENNGGGGGGGVPVLVEVNCRQHNMDFCPLTMMCIGYNALDMVLDAYLAAGGNSEGNADGDENDDDDNDTDKDANDWDRYPSVPALRAAGCMVHLVNSKQGTLVRTHHIDTIHDMESVFNYEIYEDFVTPGARIAPTTDIRTDAGWVQCVHPDPSTLEDEYNRIVDLMPTMFQVVEDESGNPSENGHENHRD